MQDNQKRQFTYKDSNFTITSSSFELIIREIIAQRTLLEDYIYKHSEFESSLVPIDCDKTAPPIVRQMCAAANICGTGPMAAVAGTIAQYGWAKAFEEKPSETIIIENGGDIYLSGNRAITIGIYAGCSPLSGRMAFFIEPEHFPLGICSSSGTMGHSLSLGSCDLATVFAKNNAVADCAATMAANMVKSADDLQKAADWIKTVPGVKGALLIKGESVALTGEIPELIKNRDPLLIQKITRDKKSHHVFY
ncbi:MAG: UPF0280 family protein [Spirochaetes bacterium]|nr:UPF0280 family protein [Spirochaetota bacterium]